MGSLFCPRVVLGLFVIAFLVEGHRLPLQASKQPYRLYPGHLQPSLLVDDHPEGPQSAVEEPVREELTELGFSQTEQMFQGPVKPMTWKYPPQTPREPEVPGVEVEVIEAVPVDSVAVRCGEADVQVEVHQDFFGTGRLIQPAEMSLGDCAATGEDPSAQVLFFESELHRCGSKLQVTEDELVYTFTLMYVPTVLPGTSIMRTNDATVDIRCHYQRRHNVSSESISPTWIPFAGAKVAEEVLVFSLRLMADDWRSERASSAYYLGEVLRIEASVIQYNHVPLCVSVHSCVATAVADANTSPRYSFIENNGCLVDAKLTGSKSQFLPKTQDDKLRFELEAFRFAQGDRNEIYITCKLLATAVSVDSNHKACSFTSNGWTNAGGNDEECLCCDSTCGTETSTDEEWQSNPSLGPVLVKNAF